MGQPPIVSTGTGIVLLTPLDEQINFFVLAGGFGPPKAQWAGDLQSPGIDHYPKLA